MLHNFYLARNLHFLEAIGLNWDKIKSAFDFQIENFSNFG